MEEYKFKPRIGLKTKDSYLNGITYNDCICQSGVIEYVGIDYFILRVEDIGPILIEDSKYWIIEENDFS